MEECVSIVSKHAKHRLRKRSSVSKRQNILAIERGYSTDNFTGSFRRYLDKIKNKRNVNLIIYSNNIFIYGSNNILITVLNVPSKYNKCFRKKSFN